MLINKFVSEILEMLASQCKHRGKSCSCKKPANLYHVTTEAKKIGVGFFFWFKEGESDDKAGFVHFSFLLSSFCFQSRNHFSQENQVDELNG